MTTTEYARTDTALLDALADEAQAAWAIHWSVCRNKHRPQGCLSCDQLDTAAHQAEQRAVRRKCPSAIGHT